MDGDVYTVDNANGTVTGEIDNAPVNGVREASATQTATVNASIKSYALATLLKTLSTPISNNGTTNNILDDTLTYDLSLRVENTDPTGNNISPAKLATTKILVGTTENTGVLADRILISDAIPTNTVFDSVVNPNANWTPVYSTVDPTSKKANDVTTEWLTTAPLVKSDIKRVGFIYTGATPIDAGTTVSGFQVKLTIAATAPTPLKVGNIAQVFGSSDDGNALLPNIPVYDESGDQSPSNYTGSTPPGINSINGVPSVNATDVPISDGYIANPNNLGTANNPQIDTGNNNTGNGPGGDYNVVDLTIPVAQALINGPFNTPAAVGPTNNNDDFTNKSSLVPLDKSAPGSTFDPSPVGFSNTVRNDGNVTNSISLLPTATINGTAIDIPTGTVVTITQTTTGDSRSYYWNGSSFLFGTTNANAVAITLASQYLTIPNVAIGATVSYGVEVNLPDLTQLSTDIGRGFPIPVTAFIDDATPGLGAVSTEARNTTIDRVYTGYLKLLKESSILKATGPDIVAGQDVFSVTPKNPRPGNVIQYRITYSNISEPLTGTGNIILFADKVVITEDGVTAPNNWGKNNDPTFDLLIDTSNVVGSAKDSLPASSSITFFNGEPATNPAGDQTGTTTTTDITKYVNTITVPVAPGISRTFTFQRKVN